MRIARFMFIGVLHGNTENNRVPESFRTYRRLQLVMSSLQQSEDLCGSVTAPIHDLPSRRRPIPKLRTRTKSRHQGAASGHPAAFQNEFRISFHKYRSDFDHPLGRR